MRRRACVDHVVRELGVSLSRACRVVGQHRSTQRKTPHGRNEEPVLTKAIILLAEQYGPCGYHRITAMLRAEGWSVDVKRVYCIWRREGLKVPMKQTKCGRLWLAEDSCVRLRPQRTIHVWSYDFV